MAAVIGLAALLYTYGLDRAPVYIGGDEAHFVSHAYSIANTGQDLNGTRWPLFIKITDLLVPNNSSRIWYQPLLFYVLAAEFRVLPVDEWSTRLPTTAIAVVNIWLVYLVARRLFGPRAGIVAAFLLALTPAHFIMSRQALDYICPLPFILGWLLCVLIYLQEQRPAWLYAAGLLLGCGAYSYISSWAVMPFLAMLTLMVARPPLRRSAAFLFAAALPVTLVVLWLWREPQILVDTLSRYRFGSESAHGLGEQLRSLAGMNLTERLTIFWDYFNPSFLFFAGGANPTMATSRIGVFVMPVAIFLVAGLARLLRRRSPEGLLLLVACLAAPLPIALTMPDAPGYSIARAFGLVPLAVLIAAGGCAMGLDSERRAIRVATAVLLAVVPLQFGGFLRDYFSDYQPRSAPRFDPVAIRDVLPVVAAIDRQQAVPAILFSDDLDDKSVRWRFYTLKEGRDDLWRKARYFDADRLDCATTDADTLLVLYAGDSRIARLTNDGHCRAVADVTSVSGTPAATILRRVE